MRIGQKGLQSMASPRLGRTCRVRGLMRSNAMKTKFLINLGAALAMGAASLAVTATPALARDGAGRHYERGDRKSVVQGKSVSVGEDLGGRRRDNKYR